MNDIRVHILQLEKELLKSEIRKSSQKISEILCKDYIEYCSSGAEYHYKKGDTFQREDDDSILNWEILDFKVEKLSKDCILARYKAIKHNGVSEGKKYSLRSSIWKYCDGKWKMFFHQGTLTSKVL